MTTTTFAPPPPPADHHPDDDRAPDPTRAGAVWVTATGAFLLFAAASVFIAVQWGNLPAEIKLAILSGMTGGFLLAGRRLRPVLPATAGVVYHLGAFLIPVNIAAVAVHREVSWPWLLLVEGVTASVAWYFLDRVERSSVLRWATTASVIVAAAGFGATVGMPTPLVLAGAALIASLCREHRNATTWALIAGLAPCLALAEHVLPFGTGVMATLGLAGSVPDLAALGSGLASALVLGREAQRRQDLVMVVLAGLSATIGVAAAWVGVAPGRGANLLGAATVFLLCEVGAQLIRRDRFWARPARITALGAEVIAGALTPCALAAAFAITVIDRSVTTVAWPELLAGLVATAAWFIGDLRRREGDANGFGLSLVLGAGWWPATLGIAGAVVAGVWAGTGSATYSAIAAVVVAAAAVLAGRPLAHGTAAGLIIAAVLAPGAAPWQCAAIAATGAAVLAAASIVRARMADPQDNGPLAWLLAMGAIVPIEAAHYLLIGRVAPMANLVATLGAVWTVAVILDRGDSTSNRGFLGAVGRIAAIATIFQAIGLMPAQIAAIAGLVAGLALFDAVRLDRVWPLFALPIAVPAGVGTGGLAIGLDIAQTGVALTVLAAALAGVHLLLEGDWRWPVLGAGIAAAVAGFALAATSFPMVSTAVIVLGGIGLAYSIAFETPEGLAFSWLGITAGIWGHLINGHEVALDAYLVPVAFALAVAGWQARTRVSSWVAFAPATVLMGGSALLERFDGGGAPHALVAGAVGVAAVVLGGSRRLSAPLLIGTGILIGLTAHETFGATRSVPTWAWLAAGGTVLLLAGILMERHNTDPFETGRRVIDTVSERFT